MESDLHEVVAPIAVADVMKGLGAAGTEFDIDHHHGPMVSVRRATYQDHEIVVETRYTITVDEEPFDIAVNVDAAGRVQYHGLPTQDFGSVIHLVEKAIDQFPDDFAQSEGPGPKSGHAGGHTHGVS